MQSQWIWVSCECYWMCSGFWWTGDNLWAPAGCTGSSQPGPAEAGRSVWTLSPPDPGPAGWTRSGQTAPAAERRRRRRRKEPQHKNKYSQDVNPCRSPKSQQITSGLESSSSESITLRGACGTTTWHWSIKRTLILRRFKSNQNNPHLRFDLLNVGLSVGHRRTGQVISESEPSHNLRSHNRTRRQFNRSHFCYLEVRRYEWNAK